MPDTISSLVPWARFIGIVFPTLYAGVTAQCFTVSDSFTFVQPIVRHAPNQKTMAKQWLHGYQYGPLWVPPLVIPGTAANIFLALNSPDPSKRLLYLIATVAIFSVAPITFLYMEPGINGASKWKVQLLLKEDGMEPMPETSIFMPSAHKHGSTQASRRWAENSSMGDLILYWRYINNFRWVIGGVAAMASGYATLSQLS